MTKYPKPVIDAAITLLRHFETLDRLLATQVVLPEDLEALARRHAAKAPEMTPEALVELWNSQRPPELATVRCLTAARRKAAGARLKEHPRADIWRKFILAISGNAWARGLRPSAACPRWKANFDWFIRPGSIVRFIEGHFTADLPGETVPTADRREDARNELDERSTAWEQE